jgi:hypothetical protein
LLTKVNEFDTSGFPMPSVIEECRSYASLSGPHTA